VVFSNTCNFPVTIATSYQRRDFSAGSWSTTAHPDSSASPSLRAEESGESGAVSVWCLFPEDTTNAPLFLFAKKVETIPKLFLP